MDNNEQLAQWDAATTNEAESTITIEQMDAMVIELRRLRDEYDAQKKKATEAHDALEKQEAVVINALNATKRTSYRVDGIGSISLQHKEMYRVPGTVEKKTELFNYIKAKYGPDALMDMVSIHSQKINSWANKEFENGVMEIPGLELPTSTEVLSLRRA